MISLIAQIGTTAKQAADVGSDAVREGYDAWIVVGGIAILAVIFAAWWYAKHG